MEDLSLVQVTRRNNKIWNLPSVILSVEQEVGTNDGNTNGDHDENQNNKEHEAVHVVDLVCPERCENKIPIGTERYKLSDQTSSHYNFFKKSSIN